jgi:hypothetical protein
MNIGLMRTMPEIAEPTFRRHGKQSVKILPSDVNFLETLSIEACPSRV